METHKRLILLLIAVAVVLGVTVAVVAAAPAAEQQAAAATPAPKGAASAGDWEKIKASGKLVVGTSADYPPFEYYTPDFKLDGFDIALIREIGKQLGVQVQIKDMAFDGLLDALQLGQIDMAIAAISVTPERDAIVDFTDVYYVGEGAVLAKKDSRIDQITSVDDVAHLRIGVQKGSVYETWLRDNLLREGNDGGEGPDALHRHQPGGPRPQSGPRWTWWGWTPSRPRTTWPRAASRSCIAAPTANCMPWRSRWAPRPSRISSTSRWPPCRTRARVSQLVQKYLKLKPDDILPVPTPDVTAADPDAGPVADA